MIVLQSLPLEHRVCISGDAIDREISGASVLLASGRWWVFMVRQLGDHEALAMLSRHKNMPCPEVERKESEQPHT
jgi:hypothetical protein